VIAHDTSILNGCAADGKDAESLKKGCKLELRRGIHGLDYGRETKM